MTRVIPFALAAVVLAGCTNQTSEPETTQGQDLAARQPYLALGDSVAFGYNPVDAVNDPTNINAFDGYPEMVTRLLSGRQAPYPVANAACEGETSGSFIDTRAQDNGCKGWRAAGDAMHVQYASSTESQLGFALAYLAANPNTATVSLGIGANDMLLVQNACEAAYDPTTDATYVADVTNCELSKMPGVIEAAAGNIGYIASAIRQSGYRGQLVLVTYYATQYTNPNDPTLQSVAGLDEAMVKVAQAYPQLGLSIAKGFSSFAAAAIAQGGGDACQAGLLYKLSDGTCNIHPSASGQLLLAAAVAAAVPASQIDLTATTPQF
jgi:lysophospholipase L1-like esterase